jgi:hypothetical protein
MSVLFAVTIELVTALIVTIENGVFPDIARTAFRHLEQAMLDYEQRTGLGNRPGLMLNVEDPGQIRYRNTLYLYGGNLLERMGRLAEAREWYLKDIDAPELHLRLGFYLTALKTCERLLCAYRVSPVAAQWDLRGAVHRVLVKSLEQAQRYAQDVLDLAARHPHLDWSQPKFRLGSQTVLFCGEACREPLLAALLYQNIVRGIPFAETDYGVLERVT